jgi:hypothetical protein
MAVREISMQKVDDSVTLFFEGISRKQWYEHSSVN